MINLRGVVLKPRKGFFLNNGGSSSSSSFSPPSTRFGRRSKSSPAMENNKAAVEAAAQKHAAATTSTSSSPPILASLVAATAGIGVVATAARVVDRSSIPVPPFDGHRQRFDQATFTGRFSRMLLQCDPSLLLYSDIQIRRAQERLQQAATAAAAAAANGGSGRSAATDHELWTAKRLVESAVNDQNKIIPQCFRMSGYVPYK
jgi:Sideroflexins